MKMNVKFILVNILFLMSTTFPQETYRDLINNLYLKNFDKKIFLNITYSYLDSNNVFLNKKLFINKNDSKIDIYFNYKDDFSINFSENNELIAISSTKNLSLYNQLLFLNIFKRISTFFFSQNIETILNSNFFSYEVEDDSTVNFYLINNIDSTNKILLQFKESERIIKNISFIKNNKTIELYHIQKLDTAYIINNNFKYTTYYYKLTKNFFKDFRLNFSPLLMLKGGFILEKNYLHNDKDKGLLFVSEYFSGTDYIISMVSTPLNEEMTEIKNLKVYNLSPILKLINLKINGFGIYLSGYLSKEQINRIKEQYKFKLKTFRSNQWNFSLFRIFLFILLSGLIIFVFLRNSRKYRR